MCMVFLGVVEPEAHWYIVFVLIFKCVLVVMHMDLSKYPFGSSWNCFLSSPWWVCWMGCMRVDNDMHVAKSLACDQPHCSPCLLHVSCWDVSLTCLGAVSSVSECYTHYYSWSCYNSFICRRSFMFFLSCCFSTCNSFFFTSSTFARSYVTLSLYSWSLQNCFHQQWTSLSLQPCSASMFSSFLLHLFHLVWCLWLLFMIMLIVMLPLDVLVYEQLDFFVSRQAHRHLIDCIPKCALNCVFISTLLEAIVPILLRGKWTPEMLGDMATLRVINLSVKNQNEHENWLKTYLGEWSSRLLNISREIGRLTAKATQGIVRLQGDWLTAGTT